MAPMDAVIETPHPGSHMPKNRRAEPCGPLQHSWFADSEQRPHQQSQVESSHLQQITLVDRFLAA